MKRTFGLIFAVLAMIAAFTITTATAQAKKKSEPLVVCKFGCEFKTIQSAVDKAKKGDTINVLPGKYKEGVIAEGHRYDGLTIQGMVEKKNGKFKKAKPKKIILEGKNAKSSEGVAQQGIEARDVKNFTVKNLTARNYVANGIYINDSAPFGPTSNGKIDCQDYVVKNTVTSFNRAYGVYAFGCAGGKMVKSEGFGHGDSAFYVGATPIQNKPKTTLLNKLEAHENVLGYSGTNSRYIKIQKGDWYNNGIGLVPNTLDSEPFEPSSDSVIQNNDIFWNNFNYFLPNSRVQTVSDGLGEFNGATLQYPTGVGVALFGATNWTVQNNNIFGNFKWGAAAFSDPFNEGDNATSTNNRFLNNQMGRNGTDTNAVDFWFDGSGSGNCLSGNVSQTVDPAPGVSDSDLYPSCPAPPAPNPGATGTSFGNLDQVGEILAYVTSTPPEKQECSWTKHDHPPYEGKTPLNVTPGPDCS